MTTWIMHWSMDGYVEVEADNRDAAFEAFNAMSSVEIRAMGDSEPPEAYFAEEVVE